MLEQLVRDAAEPEKLARLLTVHRETLGYQIVRCAEEMKIRLSEDENVDIALSMASETLSTSASRNQFAEAIANPVTKVAELVKESLAQAGKQPDAIYMTGGSARSPILRALLESTLPGVPIVAGDYFGSVTAGLARHAMRCFR